VLSGFKSLGPVAAVLRSDGATTLMVTPAWDAERAGEQCPRARIVGTEDLVGSLIAELNADAHSAVGLAGMRFLPSSITERMTAALPAVKGINKLRRQPPPADAVPAAPPEDIKLLTEIRDLLAKR
jgi:hypothetical protein